MNKTILMVTLLTSLFLGACSSGSDNAQTPAAGSAPPENSQAAESARLPLSEQAKQALEQAIKHYEDFARQHRSFLWRDTELLIAQTKEALQKGEFDLVLQNAEKVEKEVRLMQGQVEFAKKNWRKFMVNP